MRSSLRAITFFGATVLTALLSVSNAAGQICPEPICPPPPCRNVSFSPTSASFSQSGVTNYRVKVTKSPDNCRWGATSNAPWIAITGQGGGDLFFSVAANSGCTRTGTIAIGYRFLRGLLR